MKGWRLAALGRRARQVLPLVVLAAVVRLVCSAVIGLAPARFFGHATRHFPKGELAILDNGAALLFELYFRGQIRLGIAPLALTAGVVAMVVGLVPYAATIAMLKRPEEGTRGALRSALLRLGGLLLGSGLGALALAAIALLGALLQLVVVAQSGLWLKVLGLGPVLLTAAAVGVVVDAIRVRTILGNAGLGGALRSGVLLAYERFGALYLRYLVAASLQVLVAVATLAAVSSLALGSGTAVALASALAVGSIFAILAVRTWFLAALVDRIATDALQGPEEMSYVSAAAEPR